MVSSLLAAFSGGGLVPLPGHRFLAALLSLVLEYRVVAQDSLLSSFTAATACSRSPLDRLEPTVRLRSSHRRPSATLLIPVT
ncbi:hypothetical protein E2C01_053085 [Portunus trituberculatus]|uniref:Uncharacterized protein n=1 Tax=Portunus trituberculatus TaxID=210409 RepID=A0A5B7GN88_PORTR|nr:hypothetical protein [Portunus trituberculatus]